MINSVNNPEDQKKIGEYWSNRNSKKLPANNWWGNRKVLRHINKIICGEPLPYSGDGIHALAQKVLSGRKLQNGVSVGCGNGKKEMALLTSGIVETLVCYDLSKSRILEFQEEAQKKSLISRITFCNEDPFNIDRNLYDLVYWNNSLHHMNNTNFAIEWSYNKLKKGGCFLMDDYVGPNRIQFSPRTLNIANKIRSMLPIKYFVDNRHISNENTLVDSAIKYFNKDVISQDINKLISKDPSEAPDSESIIPSIQRIFTNALIKNTGGAIYFAALPPLYANFNPADEADNLLLDLLLVIDELYVASNPFDTLYAAAVSIK